MRNLDKAMASIEIRSIATGYRVLAAILSRTDAEIRVLEADHYPVPFAVILERIMKEHGVEALFDAALGDLELWNAGGRALCRKCHNTTKKGRFTKAGYLRAKAEELQLARHQQ